MWELDVKYTDPLFFFFFLKHDVTKLYEWYCLVDDTLSSLFYECPVLYLSLLVHLFPVGVFFFSTIHEKYCICPMGHNLTANCLALAFVSFSEACKYLLDATALVTESCFPLFSVPGLLRIYQSSIKSSTEFYHNRMGQQTAKASHREVRTGIGIPLSQCLVTQRSKYQPQIEVLRSRKSARYGGQVKNKPKGKAIFSKKTQPLDTTQV